VAIRESTASCVYELDQQLRLRAAGSGWNEFALENGASDLVWPRPLGHPLLMYLSDATTVQLYELLFARVTREQRPITFPIRCDGPTRRRHLSLTMTTAPAAGYVISTTLLHSEPRSPIAFLDRTVERRGRIPVAVCGWCGRLNVDGQWVEVEQALLSQRLFDRLHPPPLTNTICNACRDFMLALLVDDATVNGSS